MSKFWAQSEAFEFTWDLRLSLSSKIRKKGPYSKAARAKARGGV